MIFDEDINKLMKDLEKERDSCSPDKYGYVEADIYEKVIKRLNEINMTGYHDVDEYYE